MLTLEDKIEKYRKMKDELSNLKDDEMALRIDIVEQVGAESAGTHNFDYPGMKLKIVNKLNYVIDKDILETLDLTEEEAICIRWKPEVNLKAYKAEDETDTLDEAIIVKSSAPTVTVELAE